jgi:hypothetical protein
VVMPRNFAFIAASSTCPKRILNHFGGHSARPPATRKFPHPASAGKVPKNLGQETIASLLLNLRSISARPSVAQTEARLQARMREKRQCG